METLKNGYKEWRLSFNLKKCKYVYISKDDTESLEKKIEASKLLI